MLLSDVSSVFKEAVPPVRSALPISELLLVLAILLFPIDVALRRLVLSGEDLPAWRAALTRAPAQALPVEATVTRLRERVSDVRATRTPKPPPP